jgi:diguanylate cyclase (GGDEF)-like protein/PAS domain S-box-containing protein
MMSSFPNNVAEAASLRGESSEDGTVRKVGQIVSGRLLECRPETSVAEAARLMRLHRCSSIVVVENGHAIGIWTERDALKLDFSDVAAYDQPIGESMTRKVKSIEGDTLISDAGLRFKQEKVRHLLVVKPDGSPMGMLSQTDVVLNHGVEHYLTFRDVRSVMSKSMVLLYAHTPLSQAARRMHDEGAEAAIVVSDEWEDDGIVTERDIVRMIAERRTGTVGDAATRPVVSVHPNSTLLAARNLFSQHGFRHLAVRDESGSIMGLLCFSDILSILQYEYVAQLNAALRERDEALIRSRRDLHLARQVIEASLDGVMIVNEKGKIEYVNPAFTKLTGYGPEEVIGKNPRLLQSGQHSVEFYDQMWRSLHETGYWKGEIWNRRKDGSIIAEWLTINTIRGEDGGISKYAGLFSDITEKKQDEERVRNLAYFDALTQLPNRRLLTDRLSLAIATAHRHNYRMAVMFLDLDLFKRINDTLGHDAGDQVLVEVSKRLQDCVREGDTVARLGGDEFVVLLPELEDPADAARLARRIIESIQEPMRLGEREMAVTTSVGIALYPEDAQDSDGLLKCADHAMYQAKEIGRNRFQLHSAAANKLSSERLMAEGRLRQAIDDGSFHLVYQVKVDMTQGTVCGTEALVRWTDPELGVVPPAQFIPMAERLQLMSRLGEWVLRTACRQNRVWMDRGLPPIRMAVNLSPQQFLDGDLPETVSRVLEETGMPPELLELELTEAAIIDHPTEVGRILARLHATGVRLALDDFGTRQSSLSSLRYMPIDALKVDNSFVDCLGRAFEERDIVVAIIRLAHALGMKAVAEGVEHMHQVQVLRDAGCDEIQGYLISRAVSPEDMESMFERRLLPAE